MGRRMGRRMGGKMEGKTFFSLIKFDRDTGTGSSEDVFCLHVDGQTDEQ